MARAVYVNSDSADAIGAKGKCTLLGYSIRENAGSAAVATVLLRNGANSKQTLTEGGTGLTSFTLTYNGHTTASIPAASTAATVQTALEGLADFDPGDVVVTGATSGPYTVEFTGAYRSVAVTTLTTTPTGGTGTVTAADVTNANPIIAVIELAANASTTQALPPIDCNDGVYVDRVAGTTEVVLYVA